MTAGRPNGSPNGEPPAAQSLSPRARERLRLAAGLLRANGARVDDAAGFHAGVLAALDALPVDERALVRTLVDWIEVYCFEEARFFGVPARK